MTWPAVGTGHWALAVHRSHRLRHRCLTARTAARPIPVGMTIFCLVASCIVTKRYILAKNCLKKRIGNQGRRVDFLGRRRISTSSFAYMAIETAVFAVRSAKPCFSWASCTFLVPAHRVVPYIIQKSSKMVVCVCVDMNKNNFLWLTRLLSFLFFCTAQKPGPSIAATLLN